VNLFADESVDRPVVERLRQDSHDVVYVAELAPSITDDDVLREAGGVMGFRYANVNPT
jgi:uncharacterized protein DUF5615